MRIQLAHYPALRLDGLLPRDVWVWTPPAYQTEPNTRFPVIYMHDGQNLFEPEKSYTHVTWGVAETITRLSQWGFIRPAIVVGIDNTENRFSDYLPAKPFNSPEGKALIEKLAQEDPQTFQNLTITSDTYLKLIVEEIKPRIDQHFRTKPGQQDTIVMGSSMGGLISLYALTEYPDVFGGVGCFSTHWPVLRGLTLPYLREYLPMPGKHKIYFDYGTGGFDAEYEPYQQAVDAVMCQKGYKHGIDWLTRCAPGADHHEIAWRSRIHIPLRFFLGYQTAFSNR
jgi:predicted alpha/beta superfamily hydrolase